MLNWQLLIEIEKNVTSARYSRNHSLNDRLYCKQEDKKQGENALQETKIFMKWCRIATAYAQHTVQFSDT